MQNQQNEEAEQCAAIILMEMTGSNEAERLYSTKELLNGPLRGVMGLRKFRHLLARGEGPPAIRTTPGTKGHLRFRASDVDRWLNTFVENEADMTVPSAEDRNVMADEHKRMIRCLVNHDHAGMAQVVNNSRYPHKRHLAAALNVIARMANEADDVEQFLDVIGEIVTRD